jgi:hypothetical protein
LGDICVATVRPLVVIVVELARIVGGEEHGETALAGIAVASVPPFVVGVGAGLWPDRVSAVAITITRMAATAAAMNIQGWAMVRLMMVAEEMPRGALVRGVGYGCGGGAV